MKEGRKQRACSEKPGPAVHLNYGHYFLLILLALFLFGSFRIVQPYLHTIVLATILAGVFRPLHRRLEARLGGRADLSAFCSCLLLTLTVFFPFVFILTGLVQQGVHSFHAISEWIGGGGLEKMLHSSQVRWAVGLAERYLPGFDLKPENLQGMLLAASSTMGRAVLDHGGEIAGNVGALTGKFFLLIFIFYFLVRDGAAISASVLHLLPLATSHERQILDKIKAVSRSALLGTLITALAQGIAGGLAFLVCGLPALFWGVMMAFASLVPVVGTALIWLPAAAYLFLADRWGYGIFMVIWCVLVVGGIDNFVRPLFMKGAADMSTMLIFFSIMGGITAFGLVGILFGPLIFGMTLVLLYIYRIEFAPFLQHQDRS
ncbi:MAG: AI-2E family transporter [Thermodesulfobacteriota bacterium]